MAEQPRTARIIGLARTLARLAAMLWIQIGVTILLFAAISVVAGQAVRAVRRAREGREPAPTAGYADAPWAAAYVNAMNSVRMRWYPYVYWKTAPMRSPYLNIDEQSNRVTWNKPRERGQSGRPILRVFVLGGSTTWGAGARDDYTIPSLLAKHLAKAGSDVVVRNFGQMGWVNSQEVIYLYELLRRGERPDLVIFYDGINDTFLGYQDGIAGLTQSEFLRAQEFGILASASGRKRLYRAALRTFLMNTGLADLIKLLLGKDEGNIERREVTPLSTIAYLAPPGDFEGMDAVEQDVVNIYLFNRSFVAALGEHFKFASLFYWQPSIYSKAPLTALERNFVGAHSRQQFFGGTYQRLAATAQVADVRDISRILDGKRGYFIDEWHITEAGNDIVAQRMAADAAPMLARGTEK